MTIGERIKKLRRSLDLTQKEFGERLGVKANTIGTYEIGRNAPIDAVLNLICREFSVSETWLRTGEGEMFNPSPSNEIDAIAGQYGLSPGERKLLMKFITLNPAKRKAALDYLGEVVEAVNSDNSYEGVNFYRIPQNMTLEDMHAELDRQDADEKERGDGSSDSGSESSGAVAG